MDWFIRLREPSRTPADERAFRIWVEGSEAHRDAWKKACRTWEVMGEAASINLDIRETPMAPPVRRGSRHALAWRAGVGLAMAACLTLAVAGPSLLHRYGADFHTETAELRTFVLEDGSSVELGARSAIDTDFSDGRRRVTLIAGEAYFDVKPDPARPFVVSAEGVDVTVLGTAFDVRLRQDATDVDLVHGAVSLSVAGGSNAYAMVPGDSVSVSRDGGRITRMRVAPEDMAGWRNGRLFVENVTIASVVDEIRRYHPAWISFAGGDLANRRVTGLYDLSDPDRALEALVQPHGGTIHRVSPYLRVLSQF